jgi:hypothetical protein
MYLSSSHGLVLVDNKHPHSDNSNTHARTHNHTHSMWQAYLGSEQRPVLSQRRGLPMQVGLAHFQCHLRLLVVHVTNATPDSEDDQ